MKKIRSKFYGWCKVCGGAIIAGDMILWKKGQGASHISCPAASYKRTYGRCEDAPCCGCCD